MVVDSISGDRWTVTFDKKVIYYGKKGSIVRIYRGIRMDLTFPLSCEGI